MAATLHQVNRDHLPTVLLRTFCHDELLLVFNNTKLLVLISAGDEANPQIDLG